MGGGAGFHRGSNSHLGAAPLRPEACRRKPKLLRRSGRRGGPGGAGYYRACDAFTGPVGGQPCSLRCAVSRLCSTRVQGRLEGEAGMGGGATALGSEGQQEPWPEGACDVFRGPCVAFLLSLAASPGGADRRGVRGAGAALAADSA